MRLSITLTFKQLLTMKKQMKFGALALAIMAISFTSCESESADAIENDQAEILVEELVVTGANGRAALTDENLIEIIRYHLALDSGELTVGSFQSPEGTVEDVIFIGDDITTTEEQLIQLMEENEGLTRQFRTNNLVSAANQTIDILGYNGNDQFGLSPAAENGLRFAVNNYNRISGSNLRFNLTFGTNTGPADMIVFDNSANNPGSSGGVAGFPSGGRPNRLVQIFGLPTAANTANNNLNEHVITHEIGHSIGFRHSDFTTRFSCGQNTNEGTAGVGAIQLPGTPATDPDSIMQACFSSGEDGEFSPADITALRAMY